MPFCGTCGNYKKSKDDPNHRCGTSKSLRPSPSAPYATRTPSMGVGTVRQLSPPPSRSPVRRNQSHPIHELTADKPADNTTTSKPVSSEEGSASTSKAPASTTAIPTAPTTTEVKPSPKRAMPVSHQAPRGGHPYHMQHWPHPYHSHHHHHPHAHQRGFSPHHRPHPRVTHEQLHPEHKHHGGEVGPPAREETDGETDGEKKGDKPSTPKSDKGKKPASSKGDTKGTASPKKNAKASAKPASSKGASTAKTPAKTVTPAKKTTPKGRASPSSTGASKKKAAATPNSPAASSPGVGDTSLADLAAQTSPQTGPAPVTHVVASPVPEGHAALGPHHHHNEAFRPGHPEHHMHPLSPALGMHSVDPYAPPPPGFFGIGPYGVDMMAPMRGRRAHVREQVVAEAMARTGGSPVKATASSPHGVEPIGSPSVPQSHVHYTGSMPFGSPSMHFPRGVYEPQSARFHREKRGPRALTATKSSTEGLTTSPRFPDKKHTSNARSYSRRGGRHGTPVSGKASASYSPSGGDPEVSPRFVPHPSPRGSDWPNGKKDGEEEQAVAPASKPRQRFAATKSAYAAIPTQPHHSHYLSNRSPHPHSHRGAPGMQQRADMHKGSGQRAGHIGDGPAHYRVKDSRRGGRIQFQHHSHRSGARYGRY